MTGLQKIWYWDKFRSSVLPDKIIESQTNFKCSMHRKFNESNSLKQLYLGALQGLEFKVGFKIFDPVA